MGVAQSKSLVSDLHGALLRWPGPTSPLRSRGKLPPVQFQFEQCQLRGSQDIYSRRLPVAHTDTREVCQDVSARVVHQVVPFVFPFDGVKPIEGEGHVRGQFGQGGVVV